MLKILKKARKVIIYVNKASGILLILIGVLLITDKFKLLARF